jgi:hypothetical protein
MVFYVFTIFLWLFSQLKQLRQILEKVRLVVGHFKLLQIVQFLTSWHSTSLVTQALCSYNYGQIMGKNNTESSTIMWLMKQASLTATIQHRLSAQVINKCSHPALFFHHINLIALPFQQRKFWCKLKKSCYINFCTFLKLFFILKLCNLTIYLSGSV